MRNIDWAEAFERSRRSFDKGAPGSEESRTNWDAKAAGFAHKPKRSDYTFQLIERLDLQEGERVFDMGCGSGTLAVPLAEAGHDVIAVDFSRGMLDELERAASEHGVSDRITVYQRSWQEDLSDLPVADVSLSSRSFFTDDLADGIAKLEEHARDRVFLTCGAGDLPYRDARVFEAMGRTEDVFMFPQELMTIASYLWSTGRLPRIDYIEYPGVWHRETREELEATIRDAHKPNDDEEERRLEAFLSAHVIEDTSHGWWTLDKPREDRWAVISWKVPQAQ